LYLWFQYIYLLCTRRLLIKSFLFPFVAQILELRQMSAYKCFLAWSSFQQSSQRQIWQMFYGYLSFIHFGYTCILSSFSEYRSQIEQWIIKRAFFRWCWNYAASLSIFVIASTIYIFVLLILLFSRSLKNKWNIEYLTFLTFR
jgi:hypothetical protein